MQAIIDTIANGFGAVGDFFGGIWTAIADFFIGIWNFLAGGLVDLIAGWLNNLGFDFVLPSNVYNVLDDITRFVGYILPIEDLLPIVTITLLFYVAKIVFAVYSIIASTIIKKVHIG